MSKAVTFWAKAVMTDRCLVPFFSPPAHSGSSMQHAAATSSDIVFVVVVVADAVPILKFF